MSKFKPRYGISPEAVCTLYEYCWRAKGLIRGCGWEDFDSFVNWDAKTGYVKYARLRRIRMDKPYGPDNEFWDYPDNVKADYPDWHPCKDCDQEEGCTTPCDIRLKYYNDSIANIRGILGANSND